MAFKLWGNKREEDEKFNGLQPEEDTPGMTPGMNNKIRKQFYDGDDESDKDAEGGFSEDEGKDSDEAKEKDRILGVIERLSASLVTKRDAAVMARASCGIEQIWREDELAVEGLDEASLRNRMIDYAQETASSRGSSKNAKRSRVVINIVRPKCETAEGRFSDIQLPTDGKNWGLKPTPVPDVVKGLKDTRPVKIKGADQPLKNMEGKIQTVSDIAQSEIEAANTKMLGMEKEIDDQLNECSFNSECRKAIRNAVRLGTGIMKGPIVVKDLKKAWVKREGENGVTVRVLEVTEGFTPSSRSVDPWDVFPDSECREDIKRAGYIWERRTILPRELRDLAGIEGYLTDQIAKVLQEEPSKITVAMPKENAFLIKYNEVMKGSAYEMWEYSGDLSKDDLEALGCDCSEIGFQSVSANIVMVNDKPIKATLNPLDTGELPYDFFQWSSRTGVPWGVGVPRELMWPSRVMIAAWRAMMDNAGDSAGANVGVGVGVEPADGKWELTGKKLWWGTGDTIDMRKALSMVQVTNNQAELQAIIELALRFADMESAIPMIFNGEKGELPETLGATNIMVDSNNVALRARVKLWDDAITRPHLTRYYDWNMQYNENDEIKGDYKVDARGTSVLLERDVQGQTIKDVMSLREDPELKILVDWGKALKQYFKARNLDIMLPEEDIIKNKKILSEQPPPSDPALEVAKIRAEGDLQKVQLQQQGDQAKGQFNAQQADLDRQHETQMKIFDREIKMMELSQVSGISLDKIKAELSITAQKLNLQKELATAKNVKPAEQVATPIAEPAGRAPEGQAFQK